MTTTLLLIRSRRELKIQFHFYRALTNGQFLARDYAVITRFWLELTA